MQADSAILQSPQTVRVFQALPNSKAKIPIEEWIKCVASFLPASWIISFNPEESEVRGICHVVLQSPVRKTIGLQTDMCYDSAKQIARNLLVGLPSNLR